MKDLKKIFYSVSFLILITMVFVYTLLTHSTIGSDGYYHLVGVIEASGFTGLPAISIVLIIPAFIFGILALTLNKRIISFIRDLFGFFSGLFSAASAIIAFFYIGSGAYYIPIVLSVCAITLVVISAIQLKKAIKKSEKENNESDVSQNDKQIDAKEPDISD